MKLNRLSSVVLLALLAFIVVGSAGCASDWRKGDGPLLTYESKLTVGDSPMSNQVTVGKEPANKLAEHDPGTPFRGDSKEDDDRRGAAVAANGGGNSRRVRD
ncbi:MAG: hypothetical protein DRO99_04345 [Candidatus Aenigmatarchaeota archaeon]|mgnify:CR=1 FL=1|nr:MAG: hypothetical protein DRO99_04345 [Candidatus Aenigmarchaeota archaeon]